VTLDDLGIADLPRQMALLNDIIGFEDYWITHANYNNASNSNGVRPDLLSALLDS